MMMKMLESGGLKVLTDDIRKADMDNPKGYFEYGKVKDLKKHASWLVHAKRKVVKIISSLLYYLPPIYNYKIIFIKRDINEVLLSQAKMLKRAGQEHEINNAQLLITKFENHLQKVYKWIERQRNIECLYMNYKDIIKDPISNSSTLSDFFGGKLDKDTMINAVDSSLYRSKAY